MHSWCRRTSLGAPATTQYREVWECWHGNELRCAFPVDVTIGKPLDVLGLKDTALEEVRTYAEFLYKTVQKLYAPGGARREVHWCPCCDVDTTNAQLAFLAFDIPHHRCRQCGHLFIRSQPTPEALYEVFATSQEHSSVYTDQASIEIRLDQIVKPKLEWTQHAYRRYHGRALASAVDVGAGGGHFVEVLRRASMRAEGYEISQPSRQFAKEVFNIDLLSEDFLRADVVPGSCDLVTFWGLLEYTPEPKAFLRTARRWLDPEHGMLVLEVPRADCLGTVIQSEPTATLARHLDPTSHMNCFSDASLAAALYTSGFKPIAAWYFGLDAYELLVQQALQLDDPAMVTRLAHLIPGLQAACDRAMLCDDIVVAAVPLVQEQST